MTGRSPSFQRQLVRTSVTRDRASSTNTLRSLTLSPASPAGQVINHASPKRRQPVRVAAQGGMPMALGENAGELERENAGLRRRLAEREAELAQRQMELADALGRETATAEV